MTKDRPRNRSGNGRKSGGFQGRGEGKPTSRGDRARAPHDHGDAGRASRDDLPVRGDDKPWERRAENSAGEQKQFRDRPRADSAGKPHDRPRGKYAGKSFGKPDRDRGKPSGQPGDRTTHVKPERRFDRRFERKPEQTVEIDREERSDHTPRPGRRPDDRFGGRTGFRGKPHARPQHGGQWERRDAAFEDKGEFWIWGLHAAGAALANSERRISKAYVSRNAAARAGLDADALPAFAELLEPKEIDDRLPPGAVHQGLAVRCAPLDGRDISEAVVMPEKPLVILDQVTDPQNVGAVFRSAAAFGIGGVIMQTRNAPALGGALAKAATGAIERVAEIRAVNLSRAIDALRDAGWRVIGLDGSAEQTLGEAFAGDEPLAIVVGAEGAGIRPGVARACTGLARIPIGEAMESLNVSNAAAIAFYEASRRGGAPPPPAKPAAHAAADEDADGEETE